MAVYHLFDCIRDSHGLLKHLTMDSERLLEMMLRWTVLMAAAKLEVFHDENWQ